MASLTRRHRPYYAAFFILAVGAVVVLYFGLSRVQETAEENARQTSCNQGLLVLAVYDVWKQDRIDDCDPATIELLREKYDGAEHK